MSIQEGEFGVQASSLATQPDGGKYHVAPAPERMYNGILYASKKEATFARHLDLQVRAGEITYWLRQVPFPLPGNTTYRADFVIFKAFWDDNFPKASMQLWIVTVYEVKMYRKATQKHKEGYFFTPEAKLKMKLFRQQYPDLRIEIV